MPKDLLRPAPRPLPNVHRVTITYSTEWTKRQAARDNAAARDALGDRAERERADILAVVLAQPHRMGNASRRAGSPLWGFCEARWPDNREHAQTMYIAGTKYAGVIRDSLLAMGLPYLGQGGGIQNTHEMTEAELQAEMDTAKRNRQEADRVLLSVSRRASIVMWRTCYQELEPYTTDMPLLGKALFAVADKHFGLIDHGINALDRGDKF